MKDDKTTMNETHEIDAGRRAALSKLGLAVSSVYVAPVLMALSQPAHASKGGSGGGSGASRGGKSSGPSRSSEPSGPSAPSEPSAPSTASGPSGAESCDDSSGQDCSTSTSS